MFLSAVCTLILTAPIGHPLVSKHLDGLSKFSFWGELFLKKQIKLGSLSGCMKVIHTDCVKHNTPTAMSSHTLSASGK